LDPFGASSQIRDIRVVQASKTSGVDAVDCVRGPNPMFPESRIYRFGDGLATELPFTANVDNWFQGLGCAMKGNHKPGLGQHALKRRLIKTSARNMQSFFIAFPKKSREFVPRPTADFHNGPQDFRSAGFDPAAVGRDQEAKFDLAVPERDTKVAAGNVPALQNLRVTSRFSHGTTIAPTATPVRLETLQDGEGQYPDEKGEAAS